MKSLDLTWRWSKSGRPPAATVLRWVLLLGLRQQARAIIVLRDGDHTELGMHHPDRVEPMVPPPPHLADELCAEVRRLGRWRDRAADWWDRRRGVVLAEREGRARLLLGGSAAELHYWVLPYPGGFLSELTLLAEPGAAERAIAILQEFDDLLSAPEIAEPGAAADRGRM